MHKYRYWALLRRAYQDWHRDHDQRIKLPMDTDFVHYMLEQWGVKVHLDSYGYTEYFDIADQHKYLLFELTYAGRRDAIFDNF